MIADSIALYYGLFVSGSVGVLVVGGRLERSVLLLAVLSGWAIGYPLKPGPSEWDSPFVPIVFQILYFPLFVSASWLFLFLVARGGIALRKMLPGEIRPGIPL